MSKTAIITILVHFILNDDASNLGNDPGKQQLIRKTLTYMNLEYIVHYADICNFEHIYICFFLKKKYTLDAIC